MRNIAYYETRNSISYRDGMTFSWTNGRQLESLTKDNKTTSYTYDVNGMRTQKSIDGAVTKYYYDDNNNLVSMKVGDKTLMFYYDQNGSVSSVLYNNHMYYYIKNLQGDIMRIVDENGNSIAIYAYDQWGRPTQMRKPSSVTTDLVNYNPFLYRGYVYDSDSGLYYLQSRYYDPTTGRFLNADKYCDTQTGSTLSTNMFAYCENRPITNIDSDGNKTASWFWGIIQRVYTYDQWNPYDGYFYYGKNAPQWYVGYGSIYDHLAGVAFMDLLCLPVNFTYNNREWLIEAWKGVYGSLGWYGVSYGLFLGAEIGIYSRPADWSRFTNGSPKYGWIKYYWYKSGMYDGIASNDYLSMSMQLFKYFIHSSSLLFARTDKTWWLTGFKFSPSYMKPSSLKTIMWIRFKNNIMRNKFCYQLQYIKRKYGYNITYTSYNTEKEYVVRFSWE